MGLPPVRAHHPACPRPADRARAEHLAEELRREQPRLAESREFEHLRTRRLDPAPELHLDDFSDITLPELYGSIDFLEDRARLRADDGDLIVTQIEPVSGYEEYCRDRLGLGSVRWLRVTSDAPRRSLAAACWTDRNLREELRRGPFRYIHPHMGSFAVWALADLLARSRSEPIGVIAPPPALCRATNDKLWVADVTSRLLGPETIPRTHAASNFSTLAVIVRELSRDSSQLVVKLTDGVGGGGNLLLEAAAFRGRSLGEIRSELRTLLSKIEWAGETRVLVGCWETEVLSAPSVQLWLPPMEQGEPLAEGVFDQVIRGREGHFVGTRPARLTRALTQRLVDMAWLLGRVFQRLGYVGRCSFDFILVGGDLDSCRPELVECNARWGGTSLPMTLMARLFGDWRRVPFACHDCPLSQSIQADAGTVFATLVDRLGDDLYDVRTGEGDLILYNPAAIRHGEIALLGIGESSYDDPESLHERLASLGLSELTLAATA